MEPLVARALLALGILAAVLGAYAWRRRSRRPWTPSAVRMQAIDVPGGLRDPLTLVYFTSRFCHDCRRVPEVALAAAPEVRAVAVSVQERPDLAERYGVPATPTVLLVDHAGRIRYAHVGLPSVEELWLYVREAWDSTAAVRRPRAERRALARTLSRKG